MFHFDFTTAKASIRENVPPFYCIKLRIPRKGAGGKTYICPKAESLRAWAQTNQNKNIKKKLKIKSHV